MKITNLKYALRYLFRNPLTTFLNTLGLGLGMAALVYAVILYTHETSYDIHIPDYERVYRITDRMTMGDREMTSGSVSALVAPDLYADVPGLTAFCRASRPYYLSMKTEEDILSLGPICFVDTNFIDFMGVDRKLGAGPDVLSDPMVVVLTESKAKELFGAENPIGKQLQSDYGSSIRVSGIVQDPPVNSHLQYGALMPIANLEHLFKPFLGWDGGMRFNSYIRLAPGTTLAALEERMDDFLYTHINEKFERFGGKMELFFQPVRDVHLSTELDFDNSSNRSRSSLYIIAIISLLIVFLAIINYMNTSVASLESRTRIIGLRKVIGASPAAVKNQFMAEAFLLNLMALVLAIVLLKLGINYLNGLTSSSISLDTDLGRNLVILIGVLSATALLTGWLPARMASKAGIKRNLENRISGNPKSPLRNALLVFQFTISIVLICLLLGIGKQSSYVMRKDLGYEQEGLLNLSVFSGSSPERTRSLRSELLKLPEVQDVSLTSEALVNGVTQNGYLPEGMEQPMMIHALGTDEHFLNCFSVELLQGRNFFEGAESDMASIFINQSLADKLSWTNPVGKIINRNGKDYEVIGLVQDFNYTSLYQDVAPLLIFKRPFYPEVYNQLAVRFSTTDLLSTVKDIEKTVAEMIPGRPVSHSFYSDMLASQYTELKKTRQIISLFTILAVVIAALGIFGLTYLVNTKRTREIGVRKVNGARVSQMVWMLNMSLLRWVSLAFLLAIPASFYLLSKWLESFAYRTTLSWWIFAAGGLLAYAIAMLTVSWLSYQTARKNPVEVLRYE